MRREYVGNREIHRILCHAPHLSNGFYAPVRHTFNCEKNLPSPDQNTRMSAAGESVFAPDLKVPGEKTLVYAARMAIERDMPIHLDYYTDTCYGRAFIGEDMATKDKMLVRNEEEYTSPIARIIKVEEDHLIVLTENSIYIVNKAVKKRTITPPSA